MESGWTGYGEVWWGGVSGWVGVLGRTGCHGVGQSTAPLGVGRGGCSVGDIGWFPVGC